MVAKLLSVCVYIIGTSVGGTVGEMEDLREHSVHCKMERPITDTVRVNNDRSGYLQLYLMTADLHCH